MKSFWLKNMRGWFALDYRSLALLRVGVGFVIILDLSLRAADLFAHYTDAGLLPRFVVLEQWSNPSFFSLHLLNGSLLFQVILFGIALLFAGMLVVGYRTRLAVIVSWIFLVSLHLRNPLVLQGGDVVLRVILFWMMFLPLASRFSLDRFLNRIAPPERNSTVSPQTFAYVIQVCLVYVFSGLLKTGLSWQNGSAGYLALHLDQFATSFGVALRNHPVLVRWGTHAVRYSEIFGSLLFFMPFKIGFFRMIGIFLFVCLQVSFNVSLHLGLFGTIAIVSLFGLLPSQFWDWSQRVFDRIRQKNRPGLSIYYDSDCTFCFKVTALIQKIFLHPHTYIAPASTHHEIEQLMQEKNSWVVVPASGKKYFEWDGVVEIFRHNTYLAWIAPLLKNEYISRLGTIVYRYISSRRKKVCTPAVIQKKSAVFEKYKKVVIIFLVLYVVLWNIDGAGVNVVPQNVKWVGYVTRLDQKFNFFAPEPLTDDGWYVIPGMLRNGRTVDILTELPLTYLKPDSVLYENQRWQKYMMNLWNKDNKKFRLYYGKYLCREWNKAHAKDSNLMKFNIVFMLEKTPKEGEIGAPIKPTNIWQHSCF